MNEENTLLNKMMERNNITQKTIIARLLEFHFIITTLFDGYITAFFRFILMNDIKKEMVLCNGNITNGKLLQ